MTQYFRRVFSALALVFLATTAAPSQEGEGVNENERSSFRFPVIVYETPQQIAVREGREADASQSEKESLLHQRQSAEAAGRAASSAERQEVSALVFAGASTAIALIALGLSLFTSISSSRTTRSQLRAYVHIGDVEVHWHGMNRCSFMVWCINTGQTPAKFFEVGGICESVRRGQNRHDIIPADVEFHAWSALGGSDKLLARITPTGCDSLERRDFNNDELVLSFRGLVRYEDIFGEIFESEFSFFAHRMQFEKRKMSAPPVRLRVYDRAKKQKALSKHEAEPLSVGPAGPSTPLVAQ